MIDWETQLKLQAYLDGELPEAEKAAMADQVAQNREAAALLAELRQTRELLGDFQQGMQVPESREFYWSKINREIERRDKPALAPAATAIPWLARLRRLLVPVGAAALLLVAVLVATRQNGPPGLPGDAEIVTAQTDAGGFTYRDYDTGMTLVWLSYPADNELASGEQIGIVQ